MIKSKHVGRDDLLELIRGDGESDKTLRIGEHLHQCEDCRQALDELTAESAIWEKAPLMLHGAVMSDSHPAGTVDCHRSNASDEILPTWQYSIDELLESPRHPEMMGRIGGYDIEREIGRGGMGVVLKAHDAELNRPVAIKILAPHLANHATARKRFAQEAIAAAGVLHPNVIAVHGVNNEGKTPFIVMPYVAGPSLQALVDQQGPLTEIEIARIALQISSGLAAAHSQGLVHRDIKPANILVESGVNRVLITDFGLARAEDDASLTRTGWLTGTPNYMSPEQSRGDRPDQRSDLFSLGSLIYFLATGRLPFRAETPLGVLNRIQNDEPTPVRQVNNQISKTTADVISKLLRKSPDSRFQSAAELHEVLEQHLAFLHQPDVLKPPKVVASGNQGRSTHLKKAIAAFMIFTLALSAMTYTGVLSLPWSNAALSSNISKPESRGKDQLSANPDKSETKSGIATPGLAPIVREASMPRNNDSAQDSIGDDADSIPISMCRSDNIEGIWKAELKNDKVEIQITRTVPDSNSEWSYSTHFSPGDFAPEITESSKAFSLNKKFGNMKFEGSFTRNSGEGVFTFIGSDSFREFLAEKGVPQASDALLFRFFFSWHDEDQVIANLQELQKIGLDETTLQPLMIDGVEADLAKSYQSAKIPVADYLRFAIWRVPPALITKYKNAGLDPDKYDRFVRERVDPEFLNQYIEANLPLELNRPFIQSRVPAALLLRYKNSGFDLVEFRKFAQAHVNPELLQRYTDAGLDIEEHQDFIINRTEPAVVLKYRANRSDKK